MGKTFIAAAAAVATLGVAAPAQASISNGYARHATLTIVHRRYDWVIHVGAVCGLRTARPTDRSNRWKCEWWGDHPTYGPGDLDPTYEHCNGAFIIRKSSWTLLRGVRCWRDEA